MRATSIKPTSFETLLRLGRISNLPTIWSNVTAPYSLQEFHRTRVIGIVLLSMSLFYVGGMYLNDYFDRAVDANERPQRPIPAGDISAVSVAVLGFGILGVGVILIATIGITTALVSALLALVIIVYDAFHKGYAVAPLLMGTCRALVYCCAAISVVGTISWTVLLAAISLLSYVAELTYAARQESLDQVGRLWPLLMLAVPIFVSNTGPARRPHRHRDNLLLTATMTYATYLLIARSFPGWISRAVAILIAGISVLCSVAFQRWRSRDSGGCRNWLPDHIATAEAYSWYVKICRSIRLRPSPFRPVLTRAHRPRSCVKHLPPLQRREAFAWLSAEIERQLSSSDDRRLGVALGLAGRKFGERDLTFPSEALKKAHDLRPGWQPEFWTMGEAARIAIVLATYTGMDPASRPALTGSARWRSYPNTFPI